MDKRGSITSIVLFVIFIIVVSLIFVSLLYLKPEFKKVVGVESDFLISSGEFASKNIFGFGNPVIVKEIEGGAKNSDYQRIVVGLSIWLVFFLFFGSLLSAFSLFSRGVAWVLAFLLTSLSGFIGSIAWGVNQFINFLSKIGSGGDGASGYIILGVFIILALSLVSLLSSVSKNVKRNIERAKTREASLRAKIGAETTAKIGDAVAKAGS